MSALLGCHCVLAESLANLAKLAKQANSANLGNMAVMVKFQFS